MLDLVWGNNVYVEEHTVDVHISRLRKAFKGSNAALKDVIRAVRDGGYALRTAQ